MEAKIQATVSIRPEADGIVGINWSYSVLVKVESDGRASCYIPGFNIFFMSKDLDDVMRKADIVISLYSDHFFNHTPDGLKSLTLELHKLGFVAKNDMVTIKNLISKRPVRADFKPRDYRTSREFAGSQVMNGCRKTNQLVA